MKIYNSINYSKLFLLEDIYGKQGIVYHRTKHLDLLENIKTSGFKIGGGAMYGRGIYFCYDIKSQFQNFNINTYGEYLIKSRINLDKFLIFDYEVAKKVYGKNYTLIDQLKLLKLNKIANNPEIITMSNELENVEFSSNYALDFNKSFKNYNIQGYIYTGNHDGKAGVIFEPYLIHPISYIKTTKYNETLNKDNWIDIKDSKLIRNFNLKLSQSWNKDLNLGNKYDKFYNVEEDGSRRVELNGKFGLIDKNFKIVLEPIYDFIYDIENDGNRQVKLNGKYGLLDKNLKFVLKSIYDDIYNLDRDGSRKIKLNGKFGLIDKNLKFVLKPIYDSIYDVDSYGSRIVILNDKYGLIDKNYKEVVEPIYDFIYDGIYNLDRDGSRKIKLNGKYGLIDKNLKFVLKPTYDYISDIDDDGSRQVGLNNKYGIMDKNFNIKWNED